MNSKEPSTRLKGLVEQYNDELDAYLRIEKVYLAHMHSIADLGSKLYWLAKEEGFAENGNIDRETLNMKSREQPKEETSSSPRKRRPYKRRQGLSKKNSSDAHQHDEVHEDDVKPQS